MQLQVRAMETGSVAKRSSEAGNPKVTSVWLRYLAEFSKLSTSAKINSLMAKYDWAVRGGGIRETEDQGLESDVSNGGLWDRNFEEGLRKDPSRSL